MNRRLIFKISMLVSSLIILVCITFLTSCKCRACEDKEESSVPLEVLTKADSFIVSSTGKEFFEKYITVDFFRTKNTPPYYEMAYKFFVPEKPYVNAIIKFTVDSVGNVLKNRDVIGIPDCVNFPEYCEFNIDEQSARRVAKEKNLKEGIRDWDTVFQWDLKIQRYVWRILSTLTELGSGDNYKATGQEIVIDPNTGEMLALNDWRVN